jgi:hypothetical protein
LKRSSLHFCKIFFNAYRIGLGRFRIDTTALPQVLPEI